MKRSRSPPPALLTALLTVHGEPSIILHNADSKDDADNDEDFDDNANGDDTDDDRSWRRYPKNSAQALFCKLESALSAILERDIAQKFLFDDEADVDNGQFVVDDDNWSEERGRVGGLCVGDSFTTALVESSILILTMAMMMVMTMMMMMTMTMMKMTIMMMMTNMAKPLFEDDWDDKTTMLNITTDIDNKMTWLQC